jgi:hypothetical protein
MNRLFTITTHIAVAVPLRSENRALQIRQRSIRRLLPGP